MSASPSRPSTPSRQFSKISQSRLGVTQLLRPSSSLSNLHVHSHALESLSEPSTSFVQGQSLESSASSIISVETNEGILVQDTDADAEEVEEINVTALDSDINKGDEKSKKLLRDQLRRTLSQRTSEADVPRLPSVESISDVSSKAETQYPLRAYYVLTDAGKPVFVSPHPNEVSDDITSTIGVIQALISVFLDDGDKLRCINTGKTRITFILRPPLYYACVSSWGEPESVTRSHLEYLHLQILSIVTAAQLRRIFERRTNFDLRKLLNGAESFLVSLLGRLEFDIAMSTSSLQCLMLEQSIRKKAAEALVPTGKMKDVLYIVLVADGHVVTLIRPRKHSIHPADIHILLNTISAPSIRKSPASSSWIPICLPKFNATGFVNAYVSFLRRPESLGTEVSETNIQLNAPLAGGVRGTYSSLSPTYQQGEIVLLCISGGGDFEAIRAWCEGAVHNMEKDGSLQDILAASTSGQTMYSVSDLGIPGLRHFVYKSRPQVQITMPLFEEPYNVPDHRRRLVTLYQTLHDAIRAKSGQEKPLKLQYIRTEEECVMGWITQPFELYVSLSPRLPKSAAVGAANAVARWVKKEDAKLFLKDAPVF